MVRASATNAQIGDNTCNEMVLVVCTESVAAMMTNTNANLHKGRKTKVQLQKGVLVRLVSHHDFALRAVQVYSCLGECRASLCIEYAATHSHIGRALKADTNPQRTISWKLYNTGRAW